jgi:hypothetical protein
MMGMTRSDLIRFVLTREMEQQEHVIDKAYQIYNMLSKKKQSHEEETE